MILIGATCAAYKCDGSELAWLENAEQIRESIQDDVVFFLALQLGHGHDDRCDKLRRRMAELGGVVWTFSIDEGADEITSYNRLVGICTGRNLICEYATREALITGLLFVDTDLHLPVDGLAKLLEATDSGVFHSVGGHVPSYCLDGRPVPREQLHTKACEADPCSCGAKGWDVREHWNTAGFLLVTRAVFRWLRWRWDPQVGLTDDPCFDLDLHNAGWPRTVVRHDVIGHHESLVALEQRRADRSIRR